MKLLYIFCSEEATHFQSEQVALQAVSYQDGFSTEHGEQHGLNVSQGDGGALQILRRYTRKPVSHTRDQNQTRDHCRFS